MTWKRKMHGDFDKTIDHLQKIRADELSVKKLTGNAPSVKSMFDELKQEE